MEKQVTCCKKCECCESAASQTSKIEGLPAEQNNMEAFMKHIQTELDKLPPLPPPDREAMDFANSYHNYVQEAGDCGDMLYVMVSRLMDKHRAQLAERDAQLAAAEKTITKLQNGYALATEWALASVDEPSKKIPKWEIDRLRSIAVDMTHNCFVWRIKPHRTHTRLIAALAATR